MVFRFCPRVSSSGFSLSPCLHVAPHRLIMFHRLCICVCPWAELSADRVCVCLWSCWTVWGMSRRCCGTPSERCSPWEVSSGCSASGSCCVCWALWPTWPRRWTSSLRAWWGCWASWMTSSSSCCSSSTSPSCTARWWRSGWPDDLWPLLARVLLCSAEEFHKNTVH